MSYFKMEVYMFGWFKELFTLAGWLFSSKPSECSMNGLEVVQMKHFPFSGYKYMMWCGKIITRKSKYEVETTLLLTEDGRRSMRHETIHCAQAVAEKGDSWLRYYWKYFLNWVKRNPLSHPASACYYCNKYEVEAYANENNIDYLVGYDGSNLNGKYEIKDAKKLFRKMGHRKWKEYVKTL